MEVTLIPRYSFEYNKILNFELLSQEEQIKNFASLLSDKERFLDLVPNLEKNLEGIFKEFGFPLEQREFYVVRAEKFKSFSLPITVEYSLIPEEMCLFLLKELLKANLTQRFPDELSQEQYLLAFIEYVVSRYNFGALDLKKVVVNLEVEAEKNFENFSKISLDFSSKSFVEHLEDLYLEFFS